mmetsp:Transcript_4066/g.4697  ORF Transcript_4066/g.4697 Transcript_4066/m.4697 type:complete len:411 (+) Transcript_4066:160-1392(+)
MKQRRARIGSDTTCPESHHDHDEGEHNVYYTIKRILEKDTNKSDSVPSKILEDPEILDSTSEDSVSGDEEEVELHSDFNNEKYRFLFQIYDRKRASGIKPGMKMKFQPKFRIFDNEEKGEKIKSRNHKYKKYLNYDSFKYYKIKKEAAKAKTVESSPDSMKVEWDPSSQDPNSEEISEFEKHLSENELITKYLPKKRKNFNTAKRMNAIIQIQHGPRTVEDSIHNSEVYEYESQAAKEAMEYSSPPHKRITLQYLDNYSPEKKSRSTNFLRNRLRGRRPDICSITHKCGLAKHFSVKACNGNTRNKCNKVHEGDPKMFNRVCKMRHCKEFYCDFEEKLMEREIFDLEIPFTPQSTLQNKLREILNSPCKHENAYNEKKKKASHHDLINAIWVDGVKGHNFNKVLRLNKLS